LLPFGDAHGFLPFRTPPALLVSVPFGPARSGFEPYTWCLLLYNSLSALVKFAIASVAIGTALSALDITAAEILTDMGITPDRVLSLFSNALDWALPHFLLGAMILVPIWLIVFLLKPPGFGK